jgi:hypothetical protein
MENALFQSVKSAIDGIVNNSLKTQMVPFVLNRNIMLWIMFCTQNHCIMLHKTSCIISNLFQKIDYQLEFQIEICCLNRSDVQRSPPAAARRHSPVRKQQGKKPIIIMNRSDSDNLNNMPGKKGLALREQALSMRSCVGNNHPKASLGLSFSCCIIWAHLLHTEC